MSLIYIKQVILRRALVIILTPLLLPVSVLVSAYQAAVDDLAGWPDAIRNAWKGRP